MDRYTETTLRLFCCCCSCCLNTSIINMLWFCSATADLLCALLSMLISVVSPAMPHVSPCQVNTKSHWKRVNFISLILSSSCLGLYCIADCVYSWFASLWSKKKNSAQKKRKDGASFGTMLRQLLSIQVLPNSRNIHMFAHVSCNLLPYLTTLTRNTWFHFVDSALVS